MKTTLAALALGATLALPAAAFDLTALSDGEREAFRAEVRAYLLENPEVLMEAIGVLEQRQAAAAAEAEATLAVTYADELFNAPADFVGGNPDGDITIVEFMDYRCGYCKRAFPEVEELLSSDGNIRFIVKEYPILGDQSVLAAKYAVAVKQVNGDEAYKMVHDTLMNMRSDITPDSLAQLSDSLGLDNDAITATMESPEVFAVLQANAILGQQMQVTGTPTFVVEDYLVRGYAPLAQMEQIVAMQRAD